MFGGVCGCGDSEADNTAGLWLCVLSPGSGDAFHCLVCSVRCRWQRLFLVLFLQGMPDLVRAPHPPGGVAMLATVVRCGISSGLLVSFYAIQNGRVKVIHRLWPVLLRWACALFSEGGAILNGELMGHPSAPEVGLTAECVECFPTFLRRYNWISCKQHQGFFPCHRAQASVPLLQAPTAQ